MHEFTHAVGVAHTQSRPDRDDHVTIHWENITNKYKESFFFSRATFKTPPFSFGATFKKCVSKVQFYQVQLHRLDNVWHAL